MGSEVESATFTREQRQRYRDKVRTCLDVLARLLDGHRFDFDSSMTGMEIELNLVDRQAQPRMDNATVLAAIADDDFQTEIGRFNIEFNIPPRRIDGGQLTRLEQDLRRDLSEAERKSNASDARIVMIGILPTIMPEHFEGDWMSSNTRYAALNDAVLAARGEDIELDINGPGGERVSRFADSLAPESACTSMQLHLQTEPARFAPVWNAAQVLAGVQLGLGANSPFFFGQQLHAETRIELFTQAADTRSVELRNQGVRPRVFFGDRWITSVFDLFEENVRYYQALLPEIGDEDPRRVLESGGVPLMRELTLHNGTVYRWNRPVYDVVDDLPHLRVENRVLPAGPTIVDVVANAAFYYGAVHSLADDERPVWSRMSFATAADNFTSAAHSGIDTTQFWPGRGEVPMTELVLRDLLPRAADGLADMGVDGTAVDRYLEIIRQRCLTGRNGASWQIEAVRTLEERGLSRRDALREMTSAYIDRMHANEPVHTWDLP